MKLSFFQHIHRRIALLGGSYTHPDGTIELDIDEKAGVDPTRDCPEASKEKLYRWIAEESAREAKFYAVAWPFLLGASVGAIAMYIALSYH